MWSWPSLTCNVEVKNKWSYTSVPHTSFVACSGALLHFLFTWHTFMKMMHTAGLVGKPEGKRPPGRPTIRCHHLRMVLLCLYCNMSLVEMGTSAPNCSMLVTFWDCVYIATYPHTETGTFMSILLSVTYWDIGLLMCPYCNILSPAKAGTIMSTVYHVTCWERYHHVHMATSFHLLRMEPILHSVACWDWYCPIHMATSCHLLRQIALCPLCTMSPVETGTFASTLHSVVCWDWYCHVHMATSCHLLRLVPSCPYCSILPSPVHIDTITSTEQDECKVQSNYILTAVLQSIINTVVWEMPDVKHSRLEFKWEPHKEAFNGCHLYLTYGIFSSTLHVRCNWH